MALIAATSPGIVRVTGAPDEPDAAMVVDSADVRCLAVDPSDRLRIYAGTQGDGVLRSVDGGISWEPAGLGGMAVKALATSAAAPGELWAGTKPPRLFHSR